MKEINDNEIRVIGTPSPKPKHGKWWVAVLVILVIVVIVALVLGKESRKKSASEPQPPAAEAEASFSPSLSSSATYGHLTMVDTMVDDVPLTLYFPDSAMASLQTGQPNADDPSLLLAVMAADIRADNGGIVGDFVVDGRQLARGERKEGFCAILDGTPVIGRGGKEELERALAEKGCFFRQYVLVDNGVATPPKPKGKNHRRALCLRGDKLFVVASGDRESYHDFATALADLGATEAIALVGSESLLIYHAEGGLLHSVGTAIDSPNANFLVWRK